MKSNSDTLEQKLSKGIQELDNKEGKGFLPFLNKMQQRYGSKKQYPEEDIWLKSASNNPVFSFLKDAIEDVYSSTDGKPFNT